MKEIDLKLTDHFRLSEFFNDAHKPLLKSEVLSSYYDCVGDVISNHLCLDKASSISKNIIVIASILEKVRQLPFKILSGFRTHSVNSLCKGANGSYHLIGAACDFTFNGYVFYKKPIGGSHVPIVVSQICNDLKKLYNKGYLKELIFHDTYIHIALNNDKVKEVLPHSLILNFC